MKRRSLYTLLATLTVVVLPLFLGACASTEIPVATTPDRYQQEKLQAVDHWDNVANTVAKRVQKSLEDRPDLIHKPVYIKPSGTQAFSLAFYNLLHTRIVSKGMQVSEFPEGDCLVLEYDVQSVLHKRDSVQWMPSLAAMGIGVARFFGSGYTSPSDYEIIINSRIVYQNRYVMHLSSIHYIDDDEWAMYISPQSFDPAASTVRRVPLVNR